MRKSVAVLLILCMLFSSAGGFAEQLIPVTPVLELSEFGIPIVPDSPEANEPSAPEELPAPPEEEPVPPQDAPLPPSPEEELPDADSDPEANLPPLDDETFWEDLFTPPQPEATEPPVEPEENPEEKPEEEPGEALPDADAYIVLDGVRRYDDIEDLIPYGLEGHTIYLFHMKLIEVEMSKVEDYSFDLLKRITFELCPDENTGFTRSTVIHVSEVGSYGQDESGKDYIWAGRPKDEIFEVVQLPEEDEEEIVITEWELQVRKENYHSSEPCEPTFTLVPSPELEKGMSLAVSINGGTPESLSSDSYSPSYSGSYRFTILNADETIAAWSAAIPVEVVQYVPEWSTEVEEEQPELIVPEEEEEPFLLDLSVEEDEMNLPQTPSSQDGENGAEEPEHPEEPVVIEPAIEQQETPPADSSETAEETVLPEEQAAAEPPVQDEPAPSEEVADAAEEIIVEKGAEELPAEETEEPQPDAAVMTAEADELDELDSGMMVLPVEDDTTEPPAEEEPAPAVSGQAYYLDSDGNPVYGDLEALLSANTDTIYIATTALIVLSNSHSSALAAKTLLPASYGYSVVNVSSVSPDTQVESASSLFVWQDVKKNAAQEDAAVELSVSASQLKDGQWSNQQPSFTLSITPDSGLINTYTYGVSIDGGSVLQLTEAYSASAGASEAHFTATADGKHTYQFSLLRHDGEVVASSDVYRIWLDTTAPVLTLTTTKEYGMRVILGDSQSGYGSIVIASEAVAASEVIDAGGGVWTYTKTAKKQKIYPAGSIIVTDAAGNQAANSAEFVLYASMENMMNAMGMSSGSFGGSRGGGSGRTVYHSESDVDSVIAYNAVDLVVSQGSMTQLEIGEEVLDLVLSRNSLEQPDQADPTFTAHFTSWDGSTVDTLVLTVNEDSAVAGSEGYTWSFTGAVYKKLAASGIDYMMLCVDDEITALSTAGFTAGIRYSMYRAEGLPSKDFRYDVRMGMDELPFEMDVTVNGATYAMSADTEAEMYYYDVYTGTADELRALTK